MFAKLRFSSSENIYLEKKSLWKYLFQCNPFLRHVLNVVSVAFGPQRLNWQSSRWVAQLHDWVLSGFKSWSCGIDDPNVFV